MAGIRLIVLGTVDKRREISKSFLGDISLGHNLALGSFNDDVSLEPGYNS
jgi:hypothetical protein